MPINTGFDYGDQTSALLDDMQVSAWNGKAELIKSPTKQQFSLKGLTEDGIVEVTVSGGNRVTFPNRETGTLSFDEKNLVKGILSGDFESNSEDVIVYYPHVRGNELQGKTEFHMSLSEAGILLKKVASFLDIKDSQIKQAVQGMSTRFTLYDGFAVKLHEKDIVMGLAQVI